MRYEIVHNGSLYTLRIFDDQESKVATISFEAEEHAIQYGNEAISGENVIMWELQEDV